MFRCLGGEAREQNVRVIMRYIIKKCKYESGIMRTRVEIMRIRLLRFVAICMLLGAVFSALGFKRESPVLFYVILLAGVLLFVLFWWLSNLYRKYTNPLKFERISSQTPSLNKNSDKNADTKKETNDKKFTQRIRLIKKYMNKFGNIYINRMRNYGWTMRWEIKEVSHPITENRSKNIKLFNQNNDPKSSKNAPSGLDSEKKKEFSKKEEGCIRGHAEEFSLKPKSINV